MGTVGVDLAAEPVNTAIAVIEWQRVAARVAAWQIPADDDTVLRHVEGADKAGIDCPLGWPDTFVELRCSNSAMPSRTADTEITPWTPCHQI